MTVAMNEWMNQSIDDFFGFFFLIPQRMPRVLYHVDVELYDSVGTIEFLALTRAWQFSAKKRNPQAEKIWRMEIWILGENKV